MIKKLGKGAFNEMEKMINVKFICPKCKNNLNESDKACSACGHKGKFIDVQIKESLRLLSGTKNKIKNIIKGKKERKYITREMYLGDELRKSKGDIVEKLRDIDRLNNSYTEVVVEKESGKCIHCCKEALSAHYGHGSDKNNKLKKK